MLALEAHITYYSQLWMRAATYMKSSYATTDPELMELKDETFTKGRQLMRDEFGRYQNKGNV